MKPTTQKLSGSPNSDPKMCADAGVSCLTQISNVNHASLQDAFDQGYTAIVMSSDLFRSFWQWAAEMRKLVSEMRG